MHEPSKNEFTQTVCSKEMAKAKMMREYEKLIDHALLKADQEGMTLRELKTILCKQIIPFFKMMVAHLLGRPR